MESLSKQNKTLIFIFTAYIAFRLYALYSLPLHGYFFAYDAIRYLNDAHCGFLSLCLYTDRPFFFPLFIKICGYHYLVLILAQCLISITAWIFIACCIKKVMQSKLLGYCAIIFILCYSCADYLILWDAKALSESLSISFLLFFLGFYILALENGFSKLSVMAIIIFGFLLVNVRDGNAYFVLLSGLSSLIASFFCKSIPKNRALILFIGCLISFLFNQWTADLGQRWLIPMADLLANRVVTFPSVLQYFLKNGMPSNIVAPMQAQALQAALGTYQGYPILVSHPNALNWVIEHSRYVYSHYLLSHPSYILSIYANSSFWQDLLLTYNNALPYVTYNIPLNLTEINTTILLGFSNPISGFINMITIYLISALFIIGLIAYFDLRKFLQKDKWIISSQVLFLLSIFVLDILIWLSEPLENMRHQLSNHVQILIAIILFSFKCLDYAVLRAKDEA